MNATELSLQTTAQLKRIRTLIRTIQILLGLIALAIIVAIAFTFVEPKKIGIPPFGSYSSIHAMPSAVLILGLVRTGLLFTGIFVLNKLLRIFSNGTFFSAGSIKCIKWLGCLALADWLTVKLLHAAAYRNVTIAIDDFARLAIGLLIILIAWVMDEGRKIQDEHQLTI